MLLNELCKVCGLTKKAVEYYVSQQLVQPEILENGYRNFSRQDADALKKVATLRRLGLPVQTIREILVCETQAALRQASQQKAFELEAVQEKLSLLRVLAEGQDWEVIRQQLDDMDRKQAILTRLTNAFPGYYGNYIQLHFARYFDQPIASAEQQEAFETVVAFLDGMEFSLPADLQDYLEQAARALDRQAEERIATNMDSVIRDTEAYLNDHKDELESYLAYKTSTEYKASAAYRLQEHLYRLYRENGYYDVFLPAMKRLSPSYRAYCEELESANQIFLKQYPNVAF